jgi:hypothetical protein
MADGHKPRLAVHDAQERRKRTLREMAAVAAGEQDDGRCPGCGCRDIRKGRCRNCGRRLPRG